MDVQTRSQPPVPLMYRRTELPGVMRVSQPTVDRWISSGHLQAFRPSPRVVLVTRDEVLRFLRDQGSAVSEAGPASPATAADTANGGPHDNGTTFDD